VAGWCGADGGRCDPSGRRTSLGGGLPELMGVSLSKGVLAARACSPGDDGRARHGDHSGCAADSRLLPGKDHVARVHRTIDPVDSQGTVRGGWACG